MARNGTVCQEGSSRMAARLMPTKATQAMSIHDDRHHRSVRRDPATRAADSRERRGPAPADAGQLGGSRHATR